MSDVVLATVRDSIAQLTLNRPTTYNALNIETAQALTRALLDIGADPAIRGVIVTGSGTAFSAGGDIKFVLAHVLAHPHGPAAAFHELATHVHVCVTEIRRLRKPVIAAVNGVAAGRFFPGAGLRFPSHGGVGAAQARLHQQRAVYRCRRYVYPAAPGRAGPRPGNRRVRRADSRRPSSGLGVGDAGGSRRRGWFPMRNCWIPRWRWREPSPKNPCIPSATSKPC